MLSLTPGALVHAGWNDDVAALYHDFDPGSIWIGEDPRPARVVRVERSACRVIDAAGVLRTLTFGALPTVGDWVLAGPVGILHILPRLTELTRVDPGGDRIQSLAANIDIVAVTVGADRMNPARVEREVAAAWASDATPMVVVTKIDLDDGAIVDQLAARVVGVEVIGVCAPLGQGIEALRRRVPAGRTLVLLGPSGAGKSTLVNALVGSEQMATGQVRDQDARGRHTTSWRELLSIPGGGVLIDTPGLRGLALDGSVDVDVGFADIATLALGCRFNDCQHQREPGCAVLAAQAAGDLDPDRLASYRKLGREIAWEQSRTDPVAQRATRQNWKQRTQEGRDRRRERGTEPQ